MLRPGNVHSAEGWRAVLEPVIARYRERGLDLYFRGDAAFAKPELYELLEAEEIGYAIRLPANTVLQERIGHLLTRPVGRPPNKPQVFFASFSYQAQSWTRPRRVVAKVEWHQGELYPRVGFIVTNLKRPPDESARSTTAAAPLSSGSARASTRCAGPGCPATPSATMRSGCSSMPLPTTSPTSCARWRCPSGRAVVTDHAAREAGQDRRPDRAARPVRGIPARRGGGAARPLRGGPAPDRSAQAKAAAARSMSTESKDGRPSRARCVHDRPGTAPRRPDRRSRTGVASSRCCAPFSMPTLDAESLLLRPRGPSSAFSNPHIGDDG